MKNISDTIYTESEFFYEAGRMSYLFGNYVICQAPSRRDMKWKFPVYVIGHMSDHVVKWFFMTKDENMFREILEYYEADTDLIRALENDVNLVEGSFNELMQDTSLASIKNEKLFSLYRAYIDLRQRLSFIATNLRCIDRGAMLYFKDVFESQEVDRMISILSVSERPTMTLREEKELLEIAYRIVQQGWAMGSSQREQVLEAFVQKYSYVGHGYYNEPGKTMDECRKHLDEMVSGEPGEALAAFNLGVKRDLKEKHETLRSLDKRTCAVSHLVSEATFIKDMFKMTLNRMIHRMTPFWDVLNSKLGSDEVDARDLLSEEVEDLFNGKDVDLAVVKKRIHSSVLIGGIEGFQVFTGEKADAFKQRYLSVKKDASGRGLKGRSASQGIYCGKARVILGSQDFYKMQDGDVIVTLNTSPDFVPIMKRAGAIIAEEGGITSHASVVSRELGVPCIVGVEDATSKIHDDEIVSVDAQEGVISFIK